MRASSTKRGYDWRWRNYRAKFLRVHPYCADHYARGMIVQATVVDHIKPHRGNNELFWNQDNHQALCKLCHDSAKRREERGGMKPGCSVDGIPLDALHHWRRGRGG